MDRGYPCRDHRRDIVVASITFLVRGMFRSQGEARKVTDGHRWGGGQATLAEMRKEGAGLPSEVGEANRSEGPPRPRTGGNRVANARRRKPVVATYRSWHAPAPDRHGQGVPAAKEWELPGRPASSAPPGQTLKHDLDRGALCLSGHGNALAHPTNSAARDPIPSPKLPTFLAASARFLLTACAASPFGIGTPRIRFRVVRWASARPPASPARPAPAASAGVFAFFATSVRPLPPDVIFSCSSVSSCPSSAASSSGFATALSRARNRCSKTSAGARSRLIRSCSPA